MYAIRSYYDLVVFAVYSGNDYGDPIRNKLFRIGADGRLERRHPTIAPALREEFEQRPIETLGLAGLLRAAKRAVKLRLRARITSYNVCYTKLLRALWSRVGAFLAERRIAFVETIGALREALERGDVPYPHDWNGHPNAAGNAAIALAVGRYALSESPGLRAKTKKSAKDPAPAR